MNDTYRLPAPAKELIIDNVVGVYPQNNHSNRSEEVIASVKTSYGSASLKKVLEPIEYELTDDASLRKLVVAMAHSDDVNKLQKRNAENLFVDLSDKIKKLQAEIENGIYEITNAHLSKNATYPSVLTEVKCNLAIIIEIPRFEGERTINGGNS